MAYDYEWRDVGDGVLARVASKKDTDRLDDLGFSVISWPDGDFGPTCYAGPWRAIRPLPSWAAENLDNMEDGWPEAAHVRTIVQFDPGSGEDPDWRCYGLEADADGLRDSFRAPDWRSGQTSDSLGGLLDAVDGWYEDQDGLLARDGWRLR